MTTRLTVKLTLQQAKQVEWALGAMEDYWTSEVEADGRDGPVYPDSSLPRLVDRIGARGKPTTTSKRLVLSDVNEINEDLLYRLEVQLPDMDYQAHKTGGWDDGRAAVRAALNAAARIRHVLKYGN